jgi:hypothetical protein
MGVQYDTQTSFEEQAGQPLGQAVAWAALSWPEATRRDNPRPHNNANRLKIRRMFIDGTSSLERPASIRKGAAIRHG